MDRLTKRLKIKTATVPEPQPKMTKAEVMKIARAQKRFDDTHIQIGQVAAKAKGGRGQVQMIPVWQYIGWGRKNKYSGEMLREIRKTHR